MSSHTDSNNSNTVLQFPQKFAAVDTETTGLSPWHGHRMFAAAAIMEDGSTIFERDSFPQIKEICEDPSIDKVMHNAGFDLKMLRRAGINVRGMVWDTMIFGHLLDARDAQGHLSLDAMSKKYIPTEEGKVVVEIKAFFESKGVKTKRGVPLNFADLPTDVLRRRVIGDVHLTACLFRKLFNTVAKHFSPLLAMEHELLHIVDEMEERGMYVDIDEVTKQVEYYTEIIDELTEDLLHVAGDEFINLNSDKQIRTLLETACPGISSELEKLAGPIPSNPRKKNKRRTPKGKLPKLDDYNLRRLMHPVPHILLMYRASLKIRDTFLNQILSHRDSSNVLHPRLKQCGTLSSRFSCSDPNLQNIPSESEDKSSYTDEEADVVYNMTGFRHKVHVKRAFKCRSGYAHIHSDKKQAEMVVVAHYTNSKTMIDIFNQGISIHEGLCRVLYNDYNKGLKTRTKGVVFGFAYGAGDDTLAESIGVSVDEAIETRNRLKRTLPDLPAWEARLKDQVLTRGYVETMHGRRHYLRAGEEYIAVNRMCQGTVADEIKMCMVRINRMLKADGHDARVLLQIHDDIVTECAVDEVAVVAPKIYEIMNTSPLTWRATPAADMSITYSTWADLMEVENPQDPSTYTMEVYNAWLNSRSH